MVKDVFSKYIILLIFVSVGIFAPQVSFAAEKEDALKDEKEKIERKLKKETKELNQVQGELSAVTSVLNQVTQRVSITNDTITRITSEITQRKESIEDLTKQLTFQRNVLKSTVRELYYMESRSGVIDVLDASGSMSLTTDQDRLNALKERVSGEMDRVTKMRYRIEDAKKKLDQQKEEQKKVLAKQKREQSAISSRRSQALRTVVDQQSTVSELQSELSAVKNSLSSLLGKSVKAKDIVHAAKIASRATGVRKDFILGELVVETNLGTYTGGCTYKKSNMGTYQAGIFKKIAKSLDYNYKKLKVSCAPGYGRGGAMGVAQFMPATWKGYESRIAAATGNNPPDPWSLTDGVMAMALYLKDKGAGSKKGEFVAAKRYFCGSSNSRYWNNRCNDYARKVLYWADNYERLLK